MSKIDELKAAGVFIGLNEQNTMILSLIVSSLEAFSETDHAQGALRDTLYGTLADLYSLEQRITKLECLLETGSANG